jgi:cytochrome c oxidase assembly protein subunit 15
MSGVNIALAVAHQLTGALLLMSVVYGAHVLGRRAVG